jgi:hypothetical protein
MMMDVSETIKITGAFARHCRDAISNAWMALANENVIVEHDHYYGIIDVKVNVDGKLTETFRVTDGHVVHTDIVDGIEKSYNNGELVTMYSTKDKNHYYFTKIGPNKWKKCLDGYTIIEENGKVIERIIPKRFQTNDDELKIIKKFWLMDEYNAKLAEMDAAFDKLKAIEF